MPRPRDAFCVTLREPLDEPPESPRTAEEQAAFRQQVEGEAKKRLGDLLGRLFRWLG